MKNNRSYQICSKCLMDTTDPDIVFDEQGICNHCHRYDRLFTSRVHQGTNAEKQLESLITKIKRSNPGNDYDCIIGVSGGVDSTYVAYLSKKLGLRPLAIHFDNGWNSELAVTNIEKTLDKLGIDLYTFVIDWPSFRDLQISFLKASTPDGEIPTDHAINALLFQEANKRGIKYIINGMNFATESMAIDAWAYGHSDWKYIKGVHNIFGTKKLKKYPYYNFFNLFYWTFIKRIKVVSILNYITYNKNEVMQFLKEELGWIYYGGKHYESVYTRFYQGFILPEKFNIDKRRGHLSDLIRSGQLQRKIALQELKEPIYNAKLLIQDKEFVNKKLGLDSNSFKQIIDSPIKSFHDYPNNYKYIMTIKKLVNYLRKKGMYSK
jgi:N-acetyl sugar amidotransferase